MSDVETLKPLILDLVEWCARNQRTYVEVMDAWRTSCPRLPVWETAVDEGFLRRRWTPAEGATVEVTPAGWAFVERHGRSAELVQ